MIGSHAEGETLDVWFLEYRVRMLSEMDAPVEEILRCLNSRLCCSIHFIFVSDVVQLSSRLLQM